MNVQIDDNVAIPAARTKSVPERNIKAQDAYSAAYLAVYGVPPSITFAEPWYTIRGVTGRVALNRLKEMTAQLKYRAGE